MNQPSDLRVAQNNAATISLFRKQKHLLSLNEDEFRDLVVRPVFLRKGMTDGRDLCGPFEEGKDCVFFGSDPLRPRVIFAVQTKAGKLNMSRINQENVVVAATQLQMAINTEVTLLGTREKVRPHVVVLCTSGQINEAAKRHIVEELKDTRLHFIDSTELIPDIDKYYPEYWYGIDADKFPYYRKLKEELESLSDYLFVDADPNANRRCPVADDQFVPIHVYRMSVETKRVKGQKVSSPKHEEFPIHAILRKNEKLIVILGDAGTGKSTALRRLAYVTVRDSLATDKAQEIPVLLRATEVADDETRLVDLAAQATARLSPNHTVCFSPEDLKAGRVIVLVDALDEIADESRRKRVVDKLIAFNLDFRRCTVVLTSRRYAFTSDDAQYIKFIPFEISPFSFAQAERMVTQLVRFKAVPAEGVQEMLRQLKDVHGIELNPLLVTIFVAISDVNRQEVPANITELFKKYTELMLGRWDTSKGFAQQYQYPLKDRLLQLLALRMHRQKSPRMLLSEARTLIETELEEKGHKSDFDALYNEIIFRSGLLRQVGAVVEFKHLLLQDFFAGRAVESVDALKAVVSDRWWTHSIVFYFGNKPAGHSEIAALISSFGDRSLIDANGLYHAAIAIGQAIQACYLSRVADKLASLEWVIRTLATVMNEVLLQMSTKLKGEVISFLT